jgi:hypothetical protein
MRQNRGEVEVGINVSAPWMPTRDALDGYLDIDVVGHNVGDSVGWQKKSPRNEKRLPLS